MKKFVDFLHEGEDGSIIVIVAISLTLLLAFAGAVIDFGRLYLDKAKLQAALDAGVLAGAQDLPDNNSAELKAREYIEKNGIGENGVNVKTEGNKISANATLSLNTYFLKAIHIDTISYSAKATAQRKEKTLGGPFDYKIFSGDPASTLNLGGTFNIEGDVHANGSVNASPSHGVITGCIEANGNIYANPNTMTYGSKNDDAQVIPMVDFTSVINDNMPSSFTNVYNASDINKEWRPQTWNDNRKIIGNCTVSNGVKINADVWVEGDLTINGSGTELNGNLYATGSINFNNTTTVNGCVFAGKDINCRGGGFTVSATSSICVYSATGNIDISTSSSNVVGIVYAPNGTLSITGGTTTFYGSIIGKKVTGIPANLQLKEPTNGYPFMDSGYKIRLVE